MSSGVVSAAVSTLVVVLVSVGAGRVDVAVVVVAVVVHQCCFEVGNNSRCPILCGGVPVFWSLVFCYLVMSGPPLRHYVRPSGACLLCDSTGPLPFVLPELDKSLFNMFY